MTQVDRGAFPSAYLCASNCARDKHHCVYEEADVANSLTSSTAQLMLGVDSHCAIEEEYGLIDHAANGATSTHKAAHNTNVAPRHKGHYAIGCATCCL